MRGTVLLQLLDDTHALLREGHVLQKAAQVWNIPEDVLVYDLGHHDLQEIAQESEHARPRNGVAAVDDIERRLVQVVDQGRGRDVLFFVQAHDRLRRSECAG